jgi:pimeloyl-ACP methyl ester carboxylesterase
MPYAQTDDRRLFYTRTPGQIPDAPTLILLHGAGGSHLHWPAGLRRLPGATVYALDLPGHSRSDGPGCETIADYVAALIGFLDATGTERAVLVGHSMGGAIAQMTALTFPERVAGLVLVGTGARLRVAPAVLEGVLHEFEGTADLITRWSWAEGVPRDMVRLGRQALSETPPEVLHGDFVACDAFDVMARLGEVRAPTLVVAGTADRLTPHKYGAYLAEHIPDARLVTVEGGGHMMALEQPSVVIQAVIEFIKELYSQDDK